MIIKNSKVYDYLKFLAQILLPALGTLYATVATLCGFGGVAVVVGIIVAVDTFLGTILQLASASYSGAGVGTIEVEHREDGKKVMTLDLGENAVNNLQDKEKVTFKVKHHKA